MEKPFRYRKKLVQQGNSIYVIIPATCKISRAREVIMEVYKDKIVIFPSK